MIITRITAGMGNQMFMYAAGLATAHRLNTELRLDLLGFTAESLRKYALDVFPNLTESAATLHDIWALSPFMAIADYFHVRCNSIFKHPFRRILYEFMSRTGLLESGRAQRKARKPGSVLTPMPLSRVYAPQYSSYGEEFTAIPDNTYIAGTWESERCFADIAGLVREKFKFPDEYLNSGMSRKIRSCNAVALHVRRGDKSDYGSREGYIRRAIEMISSMTEAPSFFVFSDDIAWCRANLPQIYGVGGGCIYSLRDSLLRMIWR